MSQPLDYTNKPLEKNRYGCSGKLLVIVMVLGAIALAIFAVYNRVTIMQIGPQPQSLPTTLPADD
jgi:hypothetical protein